MIAIGSLRLNRKRNSRSVKKALGFCLVEAVFIAKAIARQAKSKASQRKAIKRVLDSLMQKEMVHQQDGFYWLPDPDQTGSDKGEQ